MALWMIAIVILSFLGMGGVAFITLLERKLLGLTQIRLGPNKVTFYGVLQPMADGVKLLSKYNIYNKTNQMILFLFSPMVLLVLFLFIWSSVITWQGNIFYIKTNSLLYFSFLGIGAYSVILTGWSSVSVFSKLGSMRGILQSLSYEVALIILFVYVLLWYKTFNISNFNNLSMEMFLFWMVLWIMMSLMESNRAPFDLLEGESELISGFNIEMGSVLFVYLFLSEYGMLIVMACITNIVVTNDIWSVSLFIVALMLMMRSCFPRIRYDSLMGLMWQSILPTSVIICFLSFF